MKINCLKVAKSGMILSKCLISFLILHFILSSNNTGKLLFSVDSFCALKNWGYTSLYNLNNYCVTPSLSEESVNDDYNELKKVLRVASTKEKTVIVTFLNKAWVAPNSIFDLFLESFKLGNNTSWLVNHLLVISLDEKAHIRCQMLVSHCYFYKTSHSSAMASEASFMTPVYLEMMWKRLAFLQTILNLGYNFVFTDTDVMWFRDPFPHFTHDSDFQTSCDDFKRNQFDNKQSIANNGYVFVRSNTRTIKLYKYWVNSRHTYPRLHDQDVFNKIKYNAYVRQIGVKIRYLDTDYFGGFCTPSRDFSKVCTMHANCCVGLGNKIADLNATLRDWKKYFLSFSSYAIPQPAHWSAPKKCLYR